MDKIKHYIDDDGDEFWTRNGYLHRTDGPAAIFKNGARYWYINGSAYAFDVYCRMLKFTPEQILELKLKYS